MRTTFVLRVSFLLAVYVSTVSMETLRREKTETFEERESMSREWKCQTVDDKEEVCAETDTQNGKQVIKITRGGKIVKVIESKDSSAEAVEKELAKYLNGIVLDKTTPQTDKNSEKDHVEESKLKKDDNKTKTPRPSTNTGKKHPDTKTKDVPKAKEDHAKETEHITKDTKKSNEGGENKSKGNEKVTKPDETQPAGSGDASRKCEPLKSGGEICAEFYGKPGNMGIRIKKNGTFMMHKKANGNCLALLERELDMFVRGLSQKKSTCE